jgi:hypothetical protein
MNTRLEFTKENPSCEGHPLCPECGEYGNPAHGNYCCEDCKYTSNRIHSDECSYGFDDGCKSR